MLIGDIANGLAVKHLVIGGGQRVGMADGKFLLAVTEFRPSYRRGAVMQASLAAVGCLAALGTWMQGRGELVLVAGILLGAVIPFTLIVILPTNRRLHDPELDPRSAEAADLLGRWGALHAVRSFAGGAAFLLLALHALGTP